MTDTDAGPEAVTETEKYRRCYQSPRYHLQGARERRVVLDVDAIPSSWTYLDVGCGRGELVQRARARGVLGASGLELVPELCGEHIRQGVITSLQWTSRAVDVVSCYDVVEHLPPDQVDQALAELVRVAKRSLLVTTNNKPSHYEDMTLHLTREPRAWWDAKLLELTRQRTRLDGDARVYRSDYGRDEWHWRIDFRPDVVDMFPLPDVELSAQTIRQF